MSRIAAVSFGIIGNRLDLNVIEDSFEVGETPCGKFYVSAFIFV